MTAREKLEHILLLMEEAGKTKAEIEELLEKIKKLILK